MTAAYPELAGLAERLDRSAVIDGEVVTMDERGRPSFERLQHRMHVRKPPPELVAGDPVHSWPSTFSGWTVTCSCRQPWPSGASASRAWRALQPVLVVEVAYREVAAAGTLRFPVLQGLRTDLAAAEVGPGAGLGD